MKHILIVDDDVHIGNTIDEALVKEGYQVSRAYSGTEALYVLSASKPEVNFLKVKIDSKVCAMIQY